jgi:hypothetical protein
MQKVMKKGKIILGAAALIVATVSALALKAHSKYATGARVYGINDFGECTLSTCRTNPSGKGQALCHTIFYLVSVVNTNGSGELWKAMNPFNGICTKPTFHWTSSTQ